MGIDTLVTTNQPDTFNNHHEHEPTDQAYLYTKEPTENKNVQNLVIDNDDHLESTPSLIKPEPEDSTKSSPNMTELLGKLNQADSSTNNCILSSSSSSSCVNSSGIGSTDLSSHAQDYELSRSPSSDTYLQQMRQKRDGSVASQNSARSSSLLDTKDGLNLLCSGKKSRKEVIPQRKRRDFIPNELKDESYWERRRKNNLAAKRSREKRRLNDIVLETKVLELTNINNVMKLKFDLCMKKYGINEDEIERMFEENKHLLVVQETLDMSELLTNEDSLIENEHFATLSSSSSSSSSGKRIKSIDDGLLLQHDTTNLTHSHKIDNSCSLSTSSSQRIDSSGRSNSSVGDDGDVENFNDAVSENELEIDEQDQDEEVKHVDENGSPPPKRKSFFNPTHTSSCPSKSPSPTLIQSPQMGESLSPIDTYQNSPQQKQHLAKKPNDMTKPNKSEPGQMKSQYPLLYNQLCKAATNTTKSKPVKPMNESSYSSLEQQNQMLLNQILSQNSGAGGGTDNRLMKTLLTELLHKQNENQLSAAPEQPKHNTNDILTKILTSAVPGSNSTPNINPANPLIERLGALLKPATPVAKSPPAKNNSQANALMEKYKNLINKTNNQQFPQATNQTTKQQSNNQHQHSLQSNRSPQQTQSKNTVNNLLQNYSGSQTINQIAPDQSQTTKTHKSSASRKRHLNQQQNSEAVKDFNNLVGNTGNQDILNAFNKQQSDLRANSQPAELNEMVAMMLAAQQQQQNNFNRGQQQSNNNQRNTLQFQQNAAKNSAKNQTYNQLLMLHQTQKLQQRQQQHEAALLNKRSNIQQGYMKNDDLAQTPDNLQLQQFLQQQQQAMNNGTQANGNNNNQANGDNNMPLKLRFKMLQLKTGEVN